MRTSLRKQKPQASGEDLWSWAERRKPPVLREDPPARTSWYRGVLRKLSSQKG